MEPFESNGKAADDAAAAAREIAVGNSNEAPASVSEAGAAPPPGANNRAAALFGAAGAAISSFSARARSALGSWRTKAAQWWTAEDEDDAANAEEELTGLRLFAKRLRRAFDIRKHLKLADEISQAISSSEFLSGVWQGVRRHILFIVIFSAAINVLYLAPSLFMLQVYDRVIPTGGLITLLLMSVVLIASLFVMGQLDAARARLLTRASLRFERLGADAIMRESLAARRKGLTPNNNAGLRELDTLRQALSSPATVGLLDLPWTPLFIIICFILNFWIGLLATGGAAVILAIALFNERASRGALKSLAGKTQRFYSSFDSDLGSAETVQALGGESAVVKRRGALRDEMVDTQTETAFINSDFSAITKTVRLGLQSVALGLGAYLAVKGQISAGAIIASSILTARAYAPVEQIVGGWRQLGMAYAALMSLKSLFADAEARPERTPLPPPVGKIQLEYISATPPASNTVALNNVSFTANPGDIIGILGPSGAGKSTLARVLSNAAPPRSGAIRIDGAKFSDWDPTALSRYFGYMPQRVDLFDGTVSDNISRFARSTGQPMDVVGPKAVEAAIAAGAHELILALPNGYETVLGLNGAGISPGQAQRIALARALYDKPKVLVLDEPNSHLDHDGEIALGKAIEQCRANGTTVFVIAHRAGVLAVVDKILVLNRGQVAEYGPRDEVLAKLSAGARPAPVAVANAGARM
jgi:PrtD family type I secretion system ABC transporter